MGAVLGMMLPALIDVGKKVVGEKITGAILGKTDGAGNVIAKGLAGSKTIVGIYTMLGLLLSMTVPPALEGNWYALGLSLAAIAAAAFAHWGRKTASAPLGKG